MELKRKQAQQVDNDLQQKAQKVGEQTDRVINRTSEASKEAYNKAKQVASEIKSDMGEAITETMLKPGRLGFAVYLYAVLGYGIFAVESLTALLLLTAWVVGYEKNKHLMRMMLNIVVLYIGLKVGWSLFYSIYSFLYKLIPYDIFGVSIAFIPKTLKAVKDIISLAYDLIFVLVGVRGMTLARKGKYIKVKFVEELLSDS